MKININKTIYGILFISGGILAGCHNTSKINATPAGTETADTTSGDTVARIQQTTTGNPGKAVFTQYCMACHQANASGVPNTFPPLNTGSWAGKNPDELITIVLKGLKGHIDVNGESYKNVMPPQSQLTDKEVADVLSYVRSNFGNNFDSVKPEMVKQVRSKIKN